MATHNFVKSPVNNSVCLLCGKSQIEHNIVNKPTFNPLTKETKQAIVELIAEPVKQQSLADKMIVKNDGAINTLINLDKQSNSCESHNSPTSIFVVFSAPSMTDTIELDTAKVNKDEWDTIIADGPLTNDIKWFIRVRPSFICNNNGVAIHKYDDGKVKLLCRDCIAWEIATKNAIIAKALEYQTPDKQEARLQAHNATISMAQAIDTSIETRADLFNAKTVALMDIKKAIDEDDTIKNKNFAFAELVMARFDKFKKVIFEHQEIIVDANNELRAAHQVMNNLALKLRVEEREKLKLADMSYQPGKVKDVPKLTKPSNAKAKINKKELTEKCAINRLPEYMVSMVITSKNCSIDEAIRIINESKSAAILANKDKVTK